MKTAKRTVNKIVLGTIILTILFAIILYCTTNVNAESTELKENIDVDISINNGAAVYDIGEISNELFGDVQVKTCEYLYNLDGSPDYIYVEYATGGYAVFLKQTMELLEYSAQGRLSYPNTTSYKFYGGPSMYLIKEADCFVDITSQERMVISQESAREYSKKTLEMLTCNYKQRKDVANVKYDCILLNGANDTNNEPAENSGGETPKFNDKSPIKIDERSGNYISNYRYFLTAPRHGENSTGTCGAIAAQLLLSYNNYYNDRRIIANRHLNGDTKNIEFNPNYCKDPMKMTPSTLGTRGTREDGSDDSNSYFAHVVNEIPAWPTINQIHSGIKNIINKRNSEISGTIDYSVNSYPFAKYPFGIISTNVATEKIATGQPIILTLQKSLGAVNHCVVAYGYCNYTYPQSTDSYTGFITHFGWGSQYLNVWVNSAWCSDFITLQVNHVHNYSTKGAIDTTGRIESVCTVCEHRTDAAINMTEQERYVEQFAIIPQNGYTYKDFYVTFATAGNKLFQTFGTEDAHMYLYDSEYKELAYNNDAGNGFNSLFNYTVSANKPYVLRVHLNYPYSLSGDKNEGIIKVGVTPSDIEYTHYNDIWSSSAAPAEFAWVSKLNTTKVICYMPTESGEYKFQMSSSDNEDTYLYLVDPISTKACLFNDDGAGHFQALIKSELIANRRYFIVACSYTLNLTSGAMALSVNKVA